MLWQSILENASTRGAPESATLLFLGSEACGKKELLRGFRHVSETRLAPTAADVFQVAHAEAATPLQSIAFRIPDPELEEAEAGEPRKGSTAGGAGGNPLLPMVTAWLVDAPEAMPLLEEVLEPSMLPRLQVVIGVDVQRPRESVAEAEAWMAAVGKTVGQVLAKAPVGDGPSAEDLRGAQCAYRAFAAQSTDGKMGLFAAGEGQDATGEDLMSPVPLVLLACNTRAEDESFVAHQKLRYLQFRLRRLAVAAKAAFGFIKPAAGDAPSEQARRVAPLQSWICHRLFPGLVPFRLGVVDTEDESFFPETLDSAGVIDALQAGDQAIAATTPLEDVFPPTPTAASATTGEEAAATPKLEADEAWLGTLESKQEDQIASFEQNLVAASKGLGLAAESIGTGADATGAPDAAKAGGTAEAKADPSNVTAFFSNLLKS